MKIHTFKHHSNKFSLILIVLWLFIMSASLIFEKDKPILPRIGGVVPPLIFIIASGMQVARRYGKNWLWMQFVDKKYFIIGTDEKEVFNWVLTNFDKKEYVIEGNYLWLKGVNSHIAFKLMYHDKIEDIS